MCSGLKGSASILMKGAAMHLSFLHNPCFFDHETVNNQLYFGELCDLSFEAHSLFRIFVRA